MTKIKQISELLRQKKQRVAVAESFTGGGIASAFVELAGASEILSLGIVCYTENAKKLLLGVKDQTLSTYGAVSEQTVSEMLDGLARLNQADILVATSGNAGPTAEKPDEVGVFYIGVMKGDRKIVNRYKVSGSRKQVIDAGIDESLNLIAELLQGK